MAAGWFFSAFVDTGLLPDSTDRGGLGSVSSGISISGSENSGGSLSLARSTKPRLGHRLEVLAHCRNSTHPASANEKPIPRHAGNVNKFPPLRFGLAVVVLHRLVEDVLEDSAGAFSEPRWYGASKDEGTTSVPSRSVLSAEVNHQPARRPKEPNPLAVSHSHLLGCLRSQRDHQTGNEYSSPLHCMIAGIALLL